MRKLIASGVDARGRGYDLYDFGARPDDKNAYRYWCFCAGTMFARTNDREGAVREMRDATEGSCYYGARGWFAIVA